MQYVNRSEGPTFKDEGEENTPGHRFVFFFLKRLYEVFGSNIDIEKTATGSGVSWSRGIAIAQAFDTNQDVEFNTEELKQLLSRMRECGHIKRR